MIWLSPRAVMPRTRNRVVCCFGVTMLTLAPTMALTRVDFPALGAPMTATKPQRPDRPPAPERRSGSPGVSVPTRLVLVKAGEEAFRCGLLGAALG